LNQTITPLPESLLSIPKFNGKDTIPIFYFEQAGRGYSHPWLAYMLYNDGKLEFLYIFEGKKGVFQYGFISKEEMQDFIYKLNQMGLFNVSNESIIEKEYYPYKVGCLEAYFSGMMAYPPRRPARLDAGEDITVDVELSGLKYKIKSYDVWREVKRFPTLMDAKILAESIDFIQEFLEAKRHEIKK